MGVPILPYLGAIATGGIIFGKTFAIALTAYFIGGGKLNVFESLNNNKELVGMVKESYSTVVTEVKKLKDDKFGDKSPRQQSQTSTVTSSSTTESSKKA